MTESVKIDIENEPGAYEIQIGIGLLSDTGDWAKACLPAAARKICIVSNKKVFGLYGPIVEKSLKKAGFTVSAWLMSDGEKYKDFKSLQDLLGFLSENQFARGDALVALGGGVVGDLCGFAASIYLRGIPFLQVPTTLVAQIDSSVGGKTAVNSVHGKNLIGTFYQPNGVLIDAETLRTLPKREFTAGMCEVIKQGAISGEPLFGQTRELLEKYPVAKLSASFDDDDFKAELTALIRAQVAFKAEIVAGDQKESLGRTDARSRKVLNFGHTIGHALEKVTKYKVLRHGEAVGYGMLAAGQIGKELDIFDQNGLTLLSGAIHSAGKLPGLHSVNAEDVFRAIAFDKKSSAGSVTWILLTGIGGPVLIDGKSIPSSLIKRSIRAILG
jgi:3-dehydroquinate synthase